MWKGSTTFEVAPLSSASWPSEFSRASFGSSFGTLLPVFADTVLQGGVETYGNLLLASGIGGLSGTILLILFGRLKDSALLQVVTGLTYGVGLLLFSQITYLPASLSFILIVGAASTAFGTINNTLLQSIVDDEFRGRVMSIHQLGWGSSAIGGLLMGTLAQAISAPFALGVSGVAVALGATSLTGAGDEGKGNASAGGTGGPEVTRKTQYYHSSDGMVARNPSITFQQPSHSRITPPCDLFPS